MARNLSRELARSPEFAGLMDRIKIEIILEGLRIEIVESANDVFFEIGTSELKANTVRLLENIGGHLKQLPNKIIVEGPTDSRPYTGNAGFLTNFELSADRANAARRALSKSGLPEKQIEEIRGCADSHLRDVKDPFNVVNRSRERRVGIADSISRMHRVSAEWIPPSGCQRSADPGAKSG
jgi:chemotaxis protein MotB